MSDSPTNSTTETPNTGSSRRKFLTRASAGAAFTLLPAKSVWANGVAHSIVASGHGSDFAGLVDMRVRSDAYWRDNTDQLVSIEKLDEFSSVFGFTPVLNTTTNTYSVTSISDVNGVTVSFTLQDVLSGSKTYVGSSGNVTVTFDNSLKQLIAAYLNAIFHNSYTIHYPILNTQAFNNDSGLFGAYLGSEYMNRQVALKAGLNELFAAPYLIV